MRRPKITVIGEGLTERWYFNHLRSVKGFKYDCKPRFFSEQSYSEMEKLIDSVVGQGGFAVCVCDADVTRVDDAAKYFADSKAVIVKLREWLPEYRKTGRFFGKTQMG